MWGGISCGPGRSLTNDLPDAAGEHPPCIHADFYTAAFVDEPEGPDVVYRAGAEETALRCCLYVEWPGGEGLQLPGRVRQDVRKEELAGTLGAGELIGCGKGGKPSGEDLQARAGVAAVEDLPEGARLPGHDVLRSGAAFLHGGLAPRTLRPRRGQVE